MDQKENLSHIQRGKGFHGLLAHHCHCSPFTCKGAWTRSTTADQEGIPNLTGEFFQSYHPLHEPPSPRPPHCTTGRCGEMAPQSPIWGFRLECFTNAMRESQDLRVGSDYLTINGPALPPHATQIKLA